MSDSPQEFMLVFSPRDEKSPWWTRWVDRRLAHVDVWVPVGESCFVAVRPLFDYLEVGFESPIYNLTAAQSLQFVRATRPQGRAMFPFGLRTCVTVAKAMLGIRDWRIQTPRQLFKFIERHNGQVG